MSFSLFQKTLPGCSDLHPHHLRQTQYFLLAAIILYCLIAVGIVWPIDGKQLAILIILFIPVGWIAMGLLLSFASIWWG